MKLILVVTIVFLASIASGYSQYLLHGSYPEFNWAKIEQDTTIEKKLDLIQKVISNSFIDSSSIRWMRDNRYTKDKYFEYYNEAISGFHIVDVNGDDEMDLIYNGSEFGGAELPVLGIFVNHGDSLSLGAKLIGSLDDVKFSNNQISEFVISISNMFYPIQEQIKYFEISDSPMYFPIDEEFGAYQEYMTEKFPYKCSKVEMIPHYTIELKDVLNKTKMFRAKNKLMLSWFPQIAPDTIDTDFELFSTLEPAIDSSNGTYDTIYQINSPNISIDYIMPNERGYIYAEKINKDKKYYFVRVLSNANIEYKSPYPVYIYGWIFEDGIEIEE